MFSTRAFSGSDVLAIATMDYQAGRFADAERGFRAALKLLPDDANVLYLLGLAEVQLLFVPLLRPAAAAWSRFTMAQ
jgi:hypothetical protein